MTPLQKLKEWVELELKLEGYEHKQILEQIEQLMPEEREGLKQSYTDGFNDKFIYDNFNHNYFTQKYGNGK